MRVECPRLPRVTLWKSSVVECYQNLHIKASGIAAMFEYVKNPKKRHLRNG